MPYPGWSKPWEQQLVEEVEAYLEGYNSAQEKFARQNHPSNYHADEEVQPHGEYPDLPEV